MMIQKIGVAAVVLMFVSTAAHAQMISPFGKKGPKMGRADIELMDKAAEPLFEGSDFKIGTSADWSNPSSGWSGKVTTIAETKKSGLGCRTLDYGFNLPKRTDTKVYRVNWCKTKDGVWRLSP